MVPIPSSPRGWDHSPLSEAYSPLDTPRLFQVEVASSTPTSTLMSATRDSECASGGAHLSVPSSRVPRAILGARSLCSEFLDLVSNGPGQARSCHESTMI